MSSESVLSRRCQIRAVAVDSISAGRQRRLGAWRPGAELRAGWKKFSTPQITQYPAATPNTNAATMVHQQHGREENRGHSLYSAQFAMHPPVFRRSGCSWPNPSAGDALRLNPLRRSPIYSRCNLTPLYPALTSANCWQIRYVSRVALSPLAEFPERGCGIREGGARLQEGRKGLFDVSS